MDTLWLGYDGLSIPWSHVVAVLVYGVAFDGLIQHSYGQVPQGVQAVVLTATGDYLPTRWQAEQLRQRWAYWRMLVGKGDSTGVQ